MTIKEVIEVLSLAKAMGKDLKNEEKNDRDIADNPCIVYKYWRNFSG